MSVTGQNGGRIVRQKRCRLRDHEAIEERSRTFWQKHCEGTEVSDLARVFGYSESYIYRLFKRLPARVKHDIKQDTTKHHRARLEQARELIHAGGLD